MKYIISDFCLLLVVALCTLVDADAKRYRPCPPAAGWRRQVLGASKKAQKKRSREWRFKKDEGAMNIEWLDKLASLQAKVAEVLLVVSS